MRGSHRAERNRALKVTGARPRIAVHGIGQFGKLMTKIALAKGFEVVAAFNRAGDKVGQDLGLLAGLDRELGVIVQDSETADCGNLQPDLVLFAATDFLDVNFPAYEKYMRAGMNVLCHGGESYFPFGANPQWAEKLDALARETGTTFTGGGIWDMSRIWAGILSAGPAHELTSMLHRSYSNIGQMIVTEYQALQGGISMSVEEFRETRGDADKSPIKFYKTIPEHVLFGLGYTLAGTEVWIEPCTLDVEARIGVFKDPIPPGRVVGSRLVAEVSTEEGVSARAEIELRLFAEGEIEHMSWWVEGKPRNYVRTERHDTPVTSASAMVNRIEDVIASRAGVVPVAELGPLKHSALM